jgi:hypothetical protein
MSEVYLCLSYAHRKQRGWKGRQWEESLQAYGSGKVLLDHVASKRFPVSLCIAYLTTCRPLTFIGSASNAQRRPSFAVVQPLKRAFKVFRL